MTTTEIIFTQKYLNSIYQSLGKAIRICFKNGDSALGIFGGLDEDSTKFLVRNFWKLDSEDLEAKKEIAFADIRFFSIIETKPQLNYESSHKRNGCLKVMNPNSHKDESENVILKQLNAKQKQIGIQNDRFRTDAEISKITSDLRGCEKKSTDGLSKVFKKFNVDFKLTEEVLENDRIDGFDQFKANKLQFGIDSQFNENDYTTILNVRELTKDQIRKADRLAKEILDTPHNDIQESRHILEERNLLELKDNDNEEILYSAVICENQKAERVQNSTHLKLDEKTQANTKIKEVVQENNQISQTGEIKITKKLSLKSRMAEKYSHQQTKASNSSNTQNITLLSRLTQPDPAFPILSPVTPFPNVTYQNYQYIQPQPPYMDMNYAYMGQPMTYYPTKQIYTYQPMEKEYPMNPYQYPFKRL